MKKLRGINIQFPISEAILSGKKVIETRTYKLPDKYIGKELLFIETPGKNGDFESRGVAVIVFEECKEYKSKKDFYNDKDLHLVGKDSPWAWDQKRKYGWLIKSCVRLNKPVKVPKKRGIVFTCEITLPDL